MKNIFIIFMVVVSLSAFSKVSPLLITQEQARVLIQGMDSDASELFDFMNVEVSKTGVIELKEIEYNNLSGELVFNIACRKKETSKNLSSCTMNVYKSNISFFVEGSSVVISTTDIVEIDKLLSLFSGESYKSNDNKLTVNLFQDFTSGLETFEIKIRN